MTSSPCTRENAIAVWRAGVEAVASDRLVKNAVEVEADALRLDGEAFAAADWDRLVVVGAGQGGGGDGGGDLPKRSPGRRGRQS